VWTLRHYCRPTGSTAAVVITLLHTVHSMLMSDNYINIFSFDFSKVFDTVRHKTLMNKGQFSFIC